MLQKQTHKALSTRCSSKQFKTRMCYLLKVCLRPQTSLYWQKWEPKPSDLKPRNKQRQPRRKRTSGFPPSQAQLLLQREQEKGNTGGGTCMWKVAFCSHQHSCSASRKNTCEMQKTLLSWESMEEWLQEQVATSPFRPNSWKVVQMWKKICAVKAAWK